MIRPSDISTTAVQHVVTAVPVWHSETRSVTAWFDAGGAGGGTRISGAVSFAARGLSIEEHTERVLQHLRGERDVPR